MTTNDTRVNSKPMAKAKKSGVELLREWKSSKSKAKSQAPLRPIDEEAKPEEACGLDVVRSFMDGERHSFGWPGDHAPVLSKARAKASSTPRRTPKEEQYAYPCDEEEEEESWRSQEHHQFGVFPDTPTAHQQEAPPCKFFFSEQGCMYGAECRFSHGEGYEQEGYTQDEKTVQICGFFAQGFCRFGEHCVYAHILPQAGCDFDMTEGGEEGEFECFDEEYEDEYFSGAASAASGAVSAAEEEHEGELKDGAKRAISPLSASVSDLTITPSRASTAASDDSWATTDSSIPTSPTTVSPEASPKPSP